MVVLQARAGKGALLVFGFPGAGPSLARLSPAVSFASRGENKSHREWRRSFEFAEVPRVS